MQPQYPNPISNSNPKANNNIVSTTIYPRFVERSQQKKGEWIKKGVNSSFKCARIFCHNVIPFSMEKISPSSKQF
jgi:hypothetical protein